MLGIITMVNIQKRRKCDIIDKYLEKNNILIERGRLWIELKCAIESKLKNLKYT